MTINEVIVALGTGRVPMTDEVVASLCSVVDGDVRRTMMNDLTPVRYQMPADGGVTLLVGNPFAEVYFLYCSAQGHMALAQYGDYQNYADQYNQLITAFKEDYRVTAIVPSQSGGTMRRVVSDLLARNDVRVRDEDVAEWCFAVDGALAQELGVRAPAPYQAVKDMDNPLFAKGSNQELYFYYCAAMLAQANRDYEQYERSMAIYERYRLGFLEERRRRADYGGAEIITVPSVLAMLRARRTGRAPSVMDVMMWCGSVDNEIRNKSRRGADAPPAMNPESTLLLSGSDGEIYITYCTSMLDGIEGNYNGSEYNMQRHDHLRRAYLAHYISTNID